MPRIGSTRRFIIGLCSVVLLTGQAVLAAAHPEYGWRSVGVHRVSAESPYAPGSCGTDASNHGYEDDPSFAVAPQGLVSTWEQDGFNTSPGAVVGYSQDGGRNWGQVVPPSAAICDFGGVSNLSAGVFEPDLAVDGNGTTFLVSANDGGSPASVSINTSHDGGATWSAPTNFVTDAPLGLMGWPTISADPSDPAAAVMAVISHQPPEAIWFSRTADDGATWSPARPVRLAPPGMVLYGARILGLPSGTLLIVATDVSYLDLPVGPPNKNVIGVPHDVVAIRSVDHGQTWSETKIADVSPAGFGSYQPALAPDGSVLELIADGAGSAQKWSLLRSTDDGASWTFAAHVPIPSDVLPNEHSLNGANLANPALAVAADGTIATLYDVTDADGKTANVVLTYSRDGGRTWNDLHLGGPFDISAIPVSGTAGPLGDYQSLSAVDDGLAAVFPLGPCTGTPSRSCPEATDGPTDVFFAGISLGPPNRADRIRIGSFNSPVASHGAS